MSFFEFPHTRTYDTDLGWIIKHLGDLLQDTAALQAWAAEHKEEYKELADKVEGLINNLVDVIEPWDSSIDYHIFTIVSWEGQNYIAVQDVPIGTMITNTDYWQPANTVIEQINAIGVKVSAVEKESPEWINVVKNGVPNDGVTDCTALLNDLFLDNARRTFYFPNGRYLITSTLFINDSINIVADNNAIIKCAENFEGETAVSFFPNYHVEDYQDVYGYPRAIIDNIQIDCNKNVNKGVSISNSVRSHFTNVKIRDFNDIGFEIVSGGSCLLDNVYMWGNNANYGYYNRSSDGSVRNCTVVNCKTGFHSLFDNLYHCTVWIDENGTYNGSVAFENIGHSGYIGCVSDTMQTSFKCADNSLTLIDNCQVINNDSVATPDNNTVIIDRIPFSRVFITNMFVFLLVAHRFTNNDDRNLSLYNVRDTYGGSYRTYVSTQDEILHPSRLDVNIDNSYLNTATNTAVIVAYFSAGALGAGSAGGWGCLIVLRVPGVAQIVQIAVIRNNTIKSRVSSDSGANWSDWT